MNHAFRPVGGELECVRQGQPRLGRIGAGLGDEVLAVVVSLDPAEVEIHCHGGAAARQLVETAIVGEGAVMATYEEVVRVRGGHGPSAAAELALPRALTLRGAEILLEQTLGALEREIVSILDHLESDTTSAIDRLTQLVDRALWGVKLLEPARIVIVGAPNVGKSALLNAIAGYARAIVDPNAGTTRDLVIVETAINGWLVEICDTAGLRETQDPIESAGIKLARAAAESADLIVAVFDRSQPMGQKPGELAGEDPGAIAVANKADLPPAWDHSARRG